MLPDSFQPTKNNIARILLGSLFLVTGIKSVQDFSKFSGMVASKNLPNPTILAALALGMKLLGGASVTLGIRTDYGRWILTAFTVLSTIIYHNPISEPSQLTNFLKNLAIIGGLLLLSD